MHNKRTQKGWTPARMTLHTWGMVAGAAITVVGGAINASNSANASADAAGSIQGGDTQAAMIQAQTLAKIQAILKPFVDTGVQANQGQADLTGLNGAPQQQFAINQVQQGPAFQSAKTLGENAILSNASATGGLRGGNVQGALGQFDEGLLGQMIQQQFNNLGGIAGLGENAAAQTGNATLATGNAQAGYAQNAGVAGAGGILGSASATNGGISSIVNAAGTAAGRLVAGGGTTPAAPAAPVNNQPVFVPDGSFG